MPAPEIAYLAEGRLYLKPPSGEATLIESHFAQQLHEREARHRQRNSWKNKSAGWQATASPLPWMQMPDDGDGRHVRITGVSRGVGLGEMLYTIDTQAVGGLFCYTLADQYERRLAHRQDYRVRDVTPHRDGSALACSLRYDDGTANLAVAASDGSRIREVTEGDSVDEAPCWHAARPGKCIVFQSAGLARAANGVPTGTGPYRIECLDLDREEMATLVEDDHYDYLQPHMRVDGAMWYIRRPYFPHGRRPRHPLEIAGDVLLFPFRLARAFGAYLNIFSLIYSGKPLTTAGGPKRDGPDVRQVLLHGRWIDLKEQERAARRNPQAAGLVPNDWVLVCRDAQGHEREVVQAVVSFDVLPTGEAIVTNGRTIFTLAPDGARQSICDGHLIEKVISTGRTT